MRILFAGHYGARLVWSLLTASAVSLVSVGVAQASEGVAVVPQRVVSLGGIVTEIVHALGADQRLVGVDQSSMYPPEARALPQVGYFRGFAVEGVLSRQPDLVLASDQAGPPQALAQLRAAGVPVVAVASQPNLTALLQGIDTVAQALVLDEEGQARAQALRQRLQEAAQPVAHDGPAPKVLILSSHTGRMQAAGAETAANAVLTLAGGANALPSLQGYKAISAEAVAAAQPDVILTSPLSLDAERGVAGFAAQPGIASTPAARNGRIVVMDDLLLLGFGPRLPLALEQLRAGLFD